jgi:hypothetical protein
LPEPAVFPAEYLLNQALVPLRCKVGDARMTHQKHASRAIAITRTYRRALGFAAGVGLSFTGHEKQDLLRDGIVALGLRQL